MKLFGWAIALAAAAMTPAAATAQSGNPPTTNVSAAERQSGRARPAATPASATLETATAAPGRRRRRRAAAPVVGSPGYMVPTPGIGVPDGRMGIQDQVTRSAAKPQAFHDNLAAVAVRDHQRVRPRRCCCGPCSAIAGPPTRPRRATPTTPCIEVVWTLVPVLILVAIAIPSIRLISAPIFAAQGRRDDQGHRPPMVLDLRISRPWASASTAIC